MKAIFIILPSILLLLFLLFAAKVRIEILAKDGKTSVFLHYLFLKFSLFPKKEKKVRPMKKKPREKKEKPEKAKKKEAGEEKKALPEKSASATVRSVLAAVRVILARFPAHFHVRVKRLFVVVSSGDAAKTALEFGLVSQGISYLFSLLDRFSHLVMPKEEDLCCRVDFVSPRSRVEIDILFGVRLYALIRLALRGGMTFFGEKSKFSPSPFVKEEEKGKNQYGKQRQKQDE